MSDPVFIATPEMEAGWDEPGVPFAVGKWYFSDETWAYAYGPYESEEAARIALKQYAETL